jgi:hypothetical protein
MPVNIIDGIRTTTVVAFGAVPRQPATDEVISNPIKIRTMSTPIEVTVESGVLTCVAASGTAVANGTYLHYMDGWCTVADMDENQPIVVSGNFSGCYFMVYRSGHGQFKCMHVYRPAGAQADNLVTAVGAYAREQGWQQMVQLGSTGLIRGEVDSVWCVAQLWPHNEIGVFRVSVGKRGQITERGEPVSIKVI